MWVEFSSSAGIITASIRAPRATETKAILGTTKSIHITIVNIDTVYIDTDIDGVNIGSMTPSKPFHHGDLKRVLFDAALALLDAHGPSGVTIRAVAKAAGVSHSAPVNHYKDRRALLTALARAQFDALLDAVDTQLAQLDNNPGPRIETFASAIMDFGFRYPQRYQLLWNANLIDHSDPELLSVMDKIYDMLCEEFSKAAPDRTFDKDTYAVALWSMIHGYVDMRLSGMFEPLNDSISGAPRGVAIIELFRKLVAS